MTFIRKNGAMLHTFYQRGPYWVRSADEFQGYEVWRDVGTHAIRVAHIGYIGRSGLARAMSEIDRRMAKEIET